MQQWLTEQANAISFLVMSILGGIVAHIRAHEKAGIEMSTGQHFWGITRRLVYAIFAGLLVWFLHIEYSWSEPLSFMLAGIVGVFGAEALEFLWQTTTDTIRRRVGADDNSKDRP